MHLETLWQIGTGDDKRPYDGLMTHYDVALLGSGTDGKWREGHPKYPGKGPIRAFAQPAISGDLIVARRGLHRALALGVIGEYDHSEAFDDVQGWDLQHYRRVRWLHNVDEHRFDRPVFRQGRFSRCHAPEVHEWAARLIASSGDDLHAPVEGDDLPELPTPKQTVEPESFGELAGILRSASRWKEKTWDGSLGARPSEDELLTHITVPLLEALDWGAEQIAVKWEFTDLALFDPVRREPANCGSPGVIVGEVIRTCVRVGGLV